MTPHTDKDTRPNPTVPRADRRRRDLVHAEGDVGPGAVAGSGSVEADKIAGRDVHEGDRASARSTLHFHQVGDSLPQWVGRIDAEVAMLAGEVRDTLATISQQVFEALQLARSANTHVFEDIAPRSRALAAVIEGNGDEGLKSQMRRLGDQVEQLGETVHTGFETFARELVAMKEMEARRFDALERRQARLTWWVGAVTLVVALMVLVPLAIVLLRAFGML